MPTVGPQLPPHLLAKRKWDDDEDREESSTGSRSPSPDSTSKRQRTVGPTLPQAPPYQPPSSPPSTSSQPQRQPSDDPEDSSSEDDFGPSLPTSNDTHKPTSNPTQPSAPPQSSSHRDAWMLVPPTTGDWTSRVDPTKLKARAFKSSKSTASKPTSNETWNETPEQKYARLQREMMGVREPKNTHTSAMSWSMSTSTAKEPVDSAEDKETKKRMKEYRAARGPSLYDAHQKSQTVEKDDDPSARAFDREKDIGAGLQMNSTQRRDLMKKAGDFGSRFSSAKYL